MSSGSLPHHPSRGGLFARLALLLIAGVLVGVPAAGAVAGVVRGWDKMPPGLWHLSWSLLATSVLWAAGLGVGGALVALPMAWVIRSRGWSAVPLALAPLWMPSYLCYAAYGLVRAPQTWLGDAIERAAGHGWAWLPAAVGRVLAAGGLVLWVWPLAAVVVGLGLRGIDQGVLDAMRLEPMSGWRRAREHARLMARPFAAGVGLITVVMLGSAVPLHLANCPTYAVRAWFDLVMTPGGSSVWVSSWPLVVIALVAGVLLTGRGRRGREGGAGPGPVGAPWRWLAWGVLAMSTVVPWALFAWSLRDWGSVVMFWRVGGAAAVAQSAAVGTLTGLVVGVAALAAWAGASLGSRGAGIVRWAAAALLVAGLAPGVLVGRAIVDIVHSVAWLRPIAEGPGALVWGQGARFAFVGVLVGWWLARAEGPAERELRLMESGGGTLAWLVTSVRARWPIVLAAGLVGGVLSLNEIEASIVIQPPGGPSLAQSLLGDLHFARSEELAAACVQLVGFGLLASAAAAWLASRAAPVDRA